MHFKIKPSPQEITEYCKNTMSDFLGIEFVETGDDYLIARMPVAERTHQSLGMLHGGASCVLAEQVGSVAANLCIDREKLVAIGLDINANHLKPIRHGFVYAKATPVHIGGRTQVWEIKLTNEDHELVCITRLTLLIVALTPETKRKHDLS